MQKKRARERGTEMETAMRLAKQIAEIVYISGEAMIDAFVDDGDGIVAVKGLEVGAGNLEISDARVGIDRFIKEAHGILDELGLFRVELGEGLFVLASDHDLSLGEESLFAQGLNIFDGKGVAWADFNTDACLAALRVGNGELTACFASMFREVGCAGTGG